jgi:hypothetical protein
MRTLAVLLLLSLLVLSFSNFVTGKSLDLETTVRDDRYATDFPHSPRGLYKLTISLRLSFTKREEILASRQRRKKQLESMLIDARQRLADHRSGSKLLSSDELKSLDKKVDIYQRKLDTMQDDLDDREVERILKREQIHNERLHERRQRRSEL